ncbi:MAG: protein kinase [Saprospiraceae bacterium]|nr:protein kinase [Pyrinomonadaceae bacterium]
MKMKPLAQNTMIQNRYLIVHLIGKGGMGEVYLAVDQRLGSAVALKRTFFAGDEMLGNAFEREARILARMRHPVLPKVSDHFGEGEEQFLVMEHISGDDLAKRLEISQKPFPASWVLFWADQLLDALSYLHSHEPPIIHRDIKPQNLKLTDENHIILLDFGLSKSSTPGQTLLNEQGTGSTGSVVGYTPHYAPMEQIRGIGTSPKSDLYSLSATLYQLMTNKVPADALSRADCLLNGMADPIKPLYELNPEISHGVSDVILKGMEVSQEKRYSNAREMQKILRKAFTEMQKATSAETVAFNLQETPVGVSDPQVARPLDPTGTSQPAKEVFAENQSAASGGFINSGGPNGQDFDATIAFDAEMEPGFVKQADVQTEIFLAGSSPFHVPEQEAAFPFVPPPPAKEENFATQDSFSETNDFSSADFDSGSTFDQPNATAPYISLQGAAAETYQDAGGQTPGFSTSPEISGSANEFDAVSTPYQETSEAASPGQSLPGEVVKPTQSKKKSTGKLIGVLVGLAALFLLVVAAAGGGWYYYTNVYLPGTVVEETPTPTPEPTLRITPTPEPTVESITNTNSSNSNGGNVFGNSNSNDNDNSMTVGPTPEPTQRTTVTSTPVPDRTPVARPTPQRPPRTPSTRPTPVKTKPTPLQ